MPPVYFGYRKLKNILGHYPFSSFFSLHTTRTEINIFHSHIYKLKKLSDIDNVSVPLYENKTK